MTYEAALPISELTAEYLAGLLGIERRRRGTRAGRRVLDCPAHAVLVLRWFLDGTRVAQLARDNGIGMCGPDPRKVALRRLPQIRAHYQRSVAYFI